MRMEAYEIGDYVSTLLKLKEKYKNQISIKIGLECEYFEKYMDGLKEMLKTYPIDYIILGNHYDGSDEDGIYFGNLGNLHNMSIAVFKQWKQVYTVMSLIRI